MEFVTRLHDIIHKEIFIVNKLLLLTLTILFAGFFVSKSLAFVEQEYKLQEVLDESTNIVFGEVKTADKLRRRATVEVKEDIKGRSGLKTIKINVAVGQVRAGSTPKMLMDHFKVGEPIIVFYRLAGGIEALGHVDGTWFQLKTHFPGYQRDINNIWWNYTHIEIYMHRTFKGTTQEFQKVLRYAMRFEDPKFLVTAIKHEDAAIRKMAVMKFAERGEPNRMLPALNDQDSAVRLFTVEKLASLNHSAGLYKALDNSDVSVRKKATEVFAAKLDMRGLYRASKDKDAVVQSIATNAFYPQDTLAKAQVVSTLIETLENLNIEMRRFAIDTLERITEERHGFDPNASEEKRKKAVDKWHSWWRKQLKPGLVGTYYRGQDFDRKVFTRVDSRINFIWGFGPPDQRVPPDFFSVRWDGLIKIDRNANYNFYVYSNDGVRFFIDGKEIISDWHRGTPMISGSKPVPLTKGYHSIKVEYFELTGEAIARLFWHTPRGLEIVPKKNLFHAEF